MKKNYITPAHRLTSYLLILSFVGCSQLLHRRSFIGQMSEEDEFLTPGEDFQVTQGDSGKTYRSREDYVKRTPASIGESPFAADDMDTQLRYELTKKEAVLTDAERYQYEEFSAVAPSPSAKIYFLNLSPADREMYLQSLQQQENVKSSYDSKSSSIGFLEERKRHDGAIALQMSKNDVEQVWGEPTRKEYAGDPSLENERWIYYHGDQEKQVFFEQGVVGGWNLK